MFYKVVVAALNTKKQEREREREVGESGSPSLGDDWTGGGGMEKQDTQSKNK